MTATATQPTYSPTAVVEAIGPGKHSAAKVFEHGLKWGHIYAAQDAGLIDILPDPVAVHGLPDDSPSIPTLIVFF